METRIPRSYRTLADLEKAVCSLCRHFGTSAVVIVGSQALLATLPDSPVILRTSGEIDAYPANALQWQSKNPGEASEEINSLFGWNSHFHESFGFYIDGVDATTAKLPTGWQSRQEARPIQCDGETVYAITPEIHDLVVSKLCRLEPKDEDFVRALHSEYPLDLALLRVRLETAPVGAETKERAARFISTLE